MRLNLYYYFFTMKSIIEENTRRNEALKTVYDPLSGEGAYGVREKRIFKNRKVLYLPVEMLLNHRINSNTPIATIEALRIRYDFEFWCARCVTIKDKVTAQNIAFILNAPQRRTLAILEEMRQNGQPIRLIMLKARQWGGSTLVQIYMAWIQIIHTRNWNSLICAHLKDTSSIIRGMYSRLLREYPAALLPDDSPMSFRPYEKCLNVSEIVGRDCFVAIGSAESQEAIRGFDIAMAHLTEVAFWPSSPLKSPENVVRSVCGAIALAPLTVIVMESTANGMGNFFHTEWLRAKAGTSDKRPVFVPWYEIEIYRMPVSDYASLWNSLDDYERNLWERGLTLEMIAWYHTKRREYNSHTQMMAEYPSDDIEAFANTGQCVFALDDIEKLREHCCPAPLVGELEGDAREGIGAMRNIRFVPSPQGNLHIWKEPDSVLRPVSNRYIVAVDIGGVSDSADYSVISVIDRKSAFGLPEVVAQWRGHTYHDILAWKAAQIARWYSNALLVIESNSLETAYTEGDGSGYILDIISLYYSNIYWRRPSPSNPSPLRRIGFHTNRRTKEQVIYSMMRIVRDSLYIEHDSRALDELSVFERQPNGSYSAMKGRHDDILMTRCIALYIADEENSRERNSASLEVLKYQY